ncbi:hypothetical protein ACOMHN_055437 [Nucella lapillus]
MGVMRATFQRIAMTEVTPVVLAVLCMLGQSAGQTFCGVDSRPHSKGLCGSMLLRAHHNLCFLLSAEYPNIFSRSIHKRSLKNIDDLPLQAYAEMDLQGGDHTEDLESGAAGSTENIRKLFLSLFPRVQSLLPELSTGSDSSQLGQGPGPKAGRVGTKRAQDLAPRVQKRGMVCDCCYNVCQASTLAQYCP